MLAINKFQIAAIDQNYSRLICSCHLLQNFCDFPISELGAQKTHRKVQTQIPQPKVFKLEAQAQISQPKFFKVKAQAQILQRKFFLALSASVNYATKIFKLKAQGRILQLKSLKLKAQLQIL